MLNWPRVVPFAPIVQFLAVVGGTWAFRHFVLPLPIVALEIALFVSAVAAVAVSGDALIDSWYDLNVHVSQKLNGARMVVAQDDVARDLLRLLAALLSAATAGWALFLPPDMDVASLIFQHGLLLITWVLLFACLTERINRRRMMWAKLTTSWAKATDAQH